MGNNKDPAFLFYSSDFLTGTMFMSNEQVGKYIRLMCAQHQKGHLKEKDMLLVCGSYDEEIYSKFVKDDEGFYFNKRLEAETAKRRNYSRSRSENRKKVDNEKTCVYLIKNPLDGLVKIGSSNKPERRLLELKNQLENEELQIIAVAESVEQKLESRLHKQYEDNCAYGEWFKLSEDQVKSIISTNHMKFHMMKHMYVHMENENENENINENRDESANEKGTISAKKSVAFIAPTLEEVTAYCRERNNNVDPESFIDFYESKGWMIGKNKMKSWKAAVRTWEKNHINADKPQPKDWMDIEF